jgi:hypothetical protein
MRHKNVKLSALFLLCIGLAGIQAQESLPASGGNAAGSGGSASYTVGQVTYTTIIGSNGSSAQCIQQPFEISVVTGLDEAGGISLQCLAYPNPTSGLIMLKVENCKTGDLSYQLFDATGKRLAEQKLEGSETTIDMSNLVPAIYFLRIIQTNLVETNLVETKHASSLGEIKNFRIIKK